MIENVRKVNLKLNEEKIGVTEYLLAEGMSLHSGKGGYDRH